jgi:hypothetical protein
MAAQRLAELDAASRMGPIRNLIKRRNGSFAHCRLKAAQAYAEEVANDKSRVT